MSEPSMSKKGELSTAHFHKSGRMLMAAASIVAPAEAPNPQSNDGWVYPAETRWVALAIKSSIDLVLCYYIADLCQAYPISLPPLICANPMIQSRSRAWRYRILNGTSYAKPYAP